MNRKPGPRPRRPLARFIVVGASANVLLFGLSYLFQKLGVSAFAAGSGAYAIAFAAAYFAQRDWTFRSTHGHGRTFLRYLAAQLCCAALSGLAGHVCVEIFAASPVWTSVTVTATAGAASYILSSLWVFADTKPPSGKRANAGSQ